MRCQYQRTFDVAPPLAGARQQIEPATVDDHRWTLAHQQACKELCVAVRLAQPGTEYQGVGRARLERMARAHRVDVGAIVVLGQPDRDQLRHAPGKDVLQRGGHGQRYKACAGARGGSPGQQRRAGVIERTADAHKGPESALVAVGIALGDERGTGSRVDRRQCLSGHVPVSASIRRKRSMRSRILRSRSSSRSSMSTGNTYKPPSVRTPNAIATA